MLKTATLQIIGDQRMYCAGCENRVTRLLKAVPGVARVRARASDQRIEVQFDTATVDVPSMADRLKRAGYETTIAE